MTDDSKALPEYRHGRDLGHPLNHTAHLRWSDGDRLEGRAEESDLSAVLAAMDPERREALLAPFVTLPNHYESNDEAGDGQMVCDVCGGPADDPHRPEECAQQVGLAVDHGWHVAGAATDEAEELRQALAAERAKVARLEKHAAMGRQLLEGCREDNRLCRAERDTERAKVAELCSFLCFPVPPSKTPHEWLDQQVRSLKRSSDWETQEHARHHQVEEEIRATLAKVEVERNRLRGFFHEFGQSMLDHLVIDQGDDYEGTKALVAILATLPKGTEVT
jgi:hypothetical protein